MLSIFFNAYSFLGITIVFIVWFGWITFLTLKNQRLFQSFFTGREKNNIQEAINKILADIKKGQEELLALKENFSSLDKEGKKHYQKIGLYRFNPFKDTGGEQSFILALLDEENTGIVISSLFSRTGNRWYVKQVKNGKGVDAQLSEEENKTVETAK
ncbi:MAG: DUF4446 family protein [Patescibacteria group bacterium]|nr:DUF4446 family protein [Patescibacteria group bacterium]